MKITRALLTVGVTAALTLATASAFAEERYLDFVHHLQDRGYGEMAIQYLERISKLEDLPDEVSTVIELEMGKSLRISAVEAANADQLQQRLAEAQTHLDKFLKENPEHPEAASALGSLGDIASQRGQILIKLGRTAADATKKADYLKNARAALEDSRPRFTQSVDRYQSRLAELSSVLPSTPKKDTTKKDTTKAPPKKKLQPTTKMQREAAVEKGETEILWLEARMKLALVDYYVAQTFSDPNDALRKASLQQASQRFDGVYQQFRTGNMHEVGLYAHMWHGKCLDELGDLRTAEDIYDEVLVNAPEGGQPQAPTGLEPLFAQVEFFRLQILQKQGKVQEFVAEAIEWLRLKKLSSSRTSGYQGIALELAKAQIAQAEQSTSEERKRLFTLSLRSLADIAKVPSDYQQEAILLRRKYQEEVKGAPTEIASFDEGLSVGDAAATAGQWDEAIAAYAKALELSAKEKDPQRGIDARLRLARAQYFGGKLADAANTAEDIARKNVTSPSAPSAAAIAVNSALSLYASAQDKKPALERLTTLAKYTIERWPERPESDDARIALGQSNTVRGDLDGAITVFEAVNPKSERYPLALHYAGQAYWKSYLTEKQRPEAARNAELLRNARTKATERLTASLDGQRKALKEGQPLPRQLMDTQLLMGEIALEGGQADQAIPLLQPLVDAVKASKPQSLDLTTLRTLVSALRAYIAIGDLARARDMQTVVVEIGGDTLPVNSVLIEFAKLLGNEVKRAEATVIEASMGTDTKAKEIAEANLNGTKEVLVKLLDQLAARQQHTLANMVYIGDAFTKLAASDKARKQYERIIERDTEDKEFAPENQKGAITRVRSQLVGLLRNEGKFPDAMTQVDQLIKANPKAMEPLLEKGRILQSWAEADKDPKRYDDAVNHWTMLRTTLSRLQRKPPEYYEVIYNAANCLLAQSKKTGDKPKALQAEQLLKSTRILSPNLSGPDMVAKYDALLEEAIKAQGRTAQAIKP